MRYRKQAGFNRLQQPCKPCRHLPTVIRGSGRIRVVTIRVFRVDLCRRSGNVLHHGDDLLRVRPDVRVNTALMFILAVIVQVHARRVILEHLPRVEGQVQIIGHLC